VKHTGRHACLRFAASGKVPVFSANSFVIFMLDSANLILMLGIVGAAVYTDIRSHRIPNNLILAGLVAAPIFQLTAHGLHGLWYGLLGALIGLASFMPFYAMRAMGAGDVKLMAVVGLLTSPRGALYAVVLSLIAGGLCAAAYLIWRAFRASINPLLHDGLAAGTLSAFVAARLAKRDRLPFALPIAVGSMAACCIQNLNAQELGAWLHRTAA
jgi:prepilin peptidase CpaA